MLRETFCTPILLNPALEVVQTGFGHSSEGQLPLLSIITRFARPRVDELPSPSHSMRARVCQSPRGRPGRPGRGSGSPVGTERASSPGQHRPKPRWMRVCFMVYRLKATLARTGRHTTRLMAASGNDGEMPPGRLGHAVSVNSQVPLLKSSYPRHAAKPALDSGRVTTSTTVRSRCLCRCQCACARPTE